MEIQDKIIFSGFADEAGVSLESQMEVFQKNGISYIEMRNVNGSHVLDQDEKAWEALRRQLDQNKFRISSIGSPIGKTPIAGDFEPEQALFQKAVKAASILGCGYIRVFSFYIPEQEDPGRWADEVRRRLESFVDIAEKNNLALALENESGVYGSSLERCIQLFDRIGSRRLTLAFDPGNFIKNNAQPYPAAYQALKGRIGYFHIKDARGGEKNFLPAGQGDSRIGELLRAAYEDGFHGFLSVEPHLHYRKELNRAQQFTTAANALKTVLNQTFSTNYCETDLDSFV